MLVRRNTLSRLAFVLIAQFLLLIAIVALAQAATGHPSLMPADRAPSWDALSAAGLSNSWNALLQGPEPTTLELAIVSSPWATLDSNPLPGEEVPQVFVVEAVITNTGLVTATGVTVTLDYTRVPTEGWALLPGEEPERQLDELSPGAAYHAYWFAQYPLVEDATHQYTVTVDADNADRVETSDNYYGNPTAGATVQTRIALSAGNSRVTQASSSVIVGVAFTLTVDYDLGNDPVDVQLSPAGNLDFDPSAYRLLATEARFYGGSPSQEITVPNRLYFSTMPSFADSVETTYTFVANSLADTRVCPYTTVGYGPGQKAKYDQFYCDEGEGTAIPITSTLSFSMTKEVSRPTIEQNGRLTYTIHYTNEGTEKLLSVWIWDDVDPDIASIEPGTATPTPDPGETTGSLVAWYLDGVEAGASGTLTFTVLVDGGGGDLADGTPLVNRAFFGINQDSLPQVAALTSTVTTTVLAPEMTITKTDGLDTVEPGEALTYTLRITNSGSVASMSVVITDDLPAEVSYDPGDVNPPPTNDTGGSLVWDNLGPIAPGDGLTITVPVTVAPVLTNGTVLTNSASVAYQNNSGWTFEPQVAEDTTVVNAPVLSVSKLANPDPVLAGHLLTYTLDYANSGPVAASNVFITDVVPLSTSYVDCSGGVGCGEDAGVVRWDIGTLDSDSSGTVTFTVEVSDALQTGTLIENDAYGITSDQTGFVGGLAVTTVVKRYAAIFEGYTFEDVDGDGHYDDTIDGILSNIPITLPASTESPTVTNSSGYYRLRVEMSGPVSISAGLPDGFFRTTAGTVFTDSILGLTQTVSFGYASTDEEFGVVYGTVFADADHDGQRDLGENGLSDVAVSSTGATTSPVWTDAYGRYTLRYAVPGAEPLPVAISETDPAGYISTTPNEVARDVVNGTENGSPVDFGDFYGIRVTGQVFDDANVDGVKDAGEAGLAHAMVAGNGDSYTTTASGFYTLYLALEGSEPVTITEQDPDGYVSTIALPGAGMEAVDAHALRIASPISGTHYTDGDFGDVLASSVITISGVVWNDNGAGGGTLANGLRDGGESGLAGAVVGLSTGLAHTTGSSGAFVLYALPGEAITVTETNPDGYVSTNAIPGNDASKVDRDTLVVDLPAGTVTSSDNLFGDVAFGSVAIITGTVFDDADEDGLRDGGEAGLPGVTVTLEIGEDMLTLLTGATGEYEFPVPPGTYVRLSSAGPGGDYYPTTPESLVVSAPTGGTYYPGYNFGYSDDPSVAVIYGLVFEDLDQDELQGGSEPGLGDVLLTLDDAFTRTTDLNGSYTFSLTEVLSHTVIETDPEDYLSTTPNTVTVSVNLGDSTQVDFGDIWIGRCSCPPDAYEDDDGVDLAVALTAGLTQTHDFCDDASDWTWFSAEAGQVFTLTTSSWGRRADTFLSLYDTDGTTRLAANDDFEGTTDFSSNIVWQAPETGTYFARVTNRAGLTACLTDYDLWMEASLLAEPYRIYVPLVARNAELGGSAVGAELVDPRGVIKHECPDDYEVDDTWQQAKPLELGVTQAHSFDSNPAIYAADKDYVSLDLAEGEHVRVRVTSLTNTLTLLELYDGQGHLLSPTGETQLIWKAMEDATFIVGISPLTSTFGCATEVGYEIVAEIPEIRTIYLPLTMRNY